MLEDLKKDARERMSKCVQTFQADLKKLRTGRAHPSLVEHLKVDYYGSEVPLQQVASIAVEEGRTLVISPWEKSVVQAIEKAIFKSDLGLTPMTAGTVIRIPMPPLTEERRREITKVLRHDAESARVAVRNVRRDVMNHIKEQLKEKLVSQDDERRAEIEEQHEQGVRLRFIGERRNLSVRLQVRIAAAEELTRGNSGLKLQVAVSYGGRWDIIQAAQRLARECSSGALRPEEISEEVFGSSLALGGVPEAELLIRTGGEYRISNFLLWELAYAELYFTSRLWPDFSVGDLEEALGFFAGRQRRFGQLSAPCPAAAKG